MKVSIEFDCDNDAFQGRMLQGEVLKILYQAQKKIGEMYPKDGAAKLLDSNGNTVGKVVLTDV